MFGYAFNLKTTQPNKSFIKLYILSKFLEWGSDFIAQLSEKIGIATTKC